jgi:hypothetical protein
MPELKPERMHSVLIVNSDEEDGKTYEYMRKGIGGKSKINPSPVSSPLGKERGLGRGVVHPTGEALTCHGWLRQASIAICAES